MFKIYFTCCRVFDSSKQDTWGVNRTIAITFSPLNVTIITPENNSLFFVNYVDLTWLVSRPFNFAAYSLDGAANVTLPFIIINKTQAEAFYSFAVDASDDSGNGHNGVVTNAIHNASASAFEFNGDNASITVGCIDRE